jgi:hypothetical protein
MRYLNKILSSAGRLTEESFSLLRAAVQTRKSAYSLTNAAAARIMKKISDAE